MNKEIIIKSARNQELANQHRMKRKMRGNGLMPEEFNLENIEDLRARRRKNLEGVTIYRRDFVLTEDSIDCA